jgi:hypothetical protein
LSRKFVIFIDFWCSVSGVSGFSLVFSLIILAAGLPGYAEGLDRVEVNVNFKVRKGLW